MRLTLNVDSVWRFVPYLLKKNWITSDHTSTRDSVLGAECWEIVGKHKILKLLWEVIACKNKSPYILFSAYFPSPIFHLCVLVSHLPCLSVLSPFPSPGCAFPTKRAATWYFVGIFSVCITVASPLAQESWSQDMVPLWFEPVVPTSWGAGGWAVLSRLHILLKLQEQPDLLMLSEAYRHGGDLVQGPADLPRCSSSEQVDEIPPHPGTMDVSLEPVSNSHLMTPW